MYRLSAFNLATLAEDYDFRALGFRDAFTGIDQASGPSFNNDVNAAPPFGPLFAVIDGTSNDDTLIGTAGDDTINGFGGNDSINGLGGNDTLSGGLGDDIINGGDGADFINTGVDSNNHAGNDIITGGNGDDHIYVSEEADSVDGGNDIDTLYLRSVFTDINFTHVTGGVSTFTGGLQVTNIENYNLELDGSGTDIIYLGSGDDVVNAFLGADEIHGGAGSDAILALGSNSAVYGDAGDDYLTISGVSGSVAFGGAGNDELSFDGSGAAFSATLDGGDGDDTIFVADSNFTAIAGLELTDCRF